MWILQLRNDLSWGYVTFFFMSWLLETQADKAGDSSDNVLDAVARPGKAELRPGLLLAPDVPREAVRGLGTSSALDGDQALR